MENPPIKCTIGATQLKEWLIEDTDLPLRLSNTAIQGDLDLGFTRIRRPVAIKECEFRGKVDVRNTRFNATLSLTNCLFQGQFNSGDRNLSHTMYAEDMVFTGCTFANEAWFIGVQCEGSGLFQGCVFKSAVLPDDMNVPQTVDFNGAKFGKALEMNSASFNGATNFNAVKCGIGASFHDANFNSQDAAVNFVAASFGMACELVRATFHGPVLFEGLSCGLALNFEFAKFVHPTASVTFASVSTPNLTARASHFHGPTDFSSMRCQNASFDAYIVDTDVPSDQAFSPGDISAALRTAFKNYNMPLAADASIEQKDNDWRVLSDGRVSYFLEYVDGRVRIIAPTRFEGATAFNQSQFDWILNLYGAMFESTASFNGVRCGGGGFFVNCRFNSKETADFRFSSYGVNLEFVDAKSSCLIDLESSSITSDLRLAGATLHAGINLTNTSMRRLALGRAFPLEGQLSSFRGCRFEIFEAPPRSERMPQWSWDNVVGAQKTSDFTRDIYHMLERYYRSDGQELEADRIYYAGRLAERKLAGRAKSGVDWPAQKWLTDSMSKWLTGYGVHFLQLLTWILAFAMLGVVVFWADDALVPVKPPSAASNVATSEEDVLLGKPAREATAAPAPTPPAPTPGAVQPQPETSGVNKGLPKFVARLGYSLDELLPVVNLHIADHWRPSTSLRSAYLALHILVGWILIPLLIGAFTGMLTKK